LFHDESLPSDEDLGEELDNLYCVACDKLFKTVGAKDNHETSKKHRDNLEKLIVEMNEDVDCVQEDERQSFSDEESNDHGVKIPSDTNKLETRVRSKSKKQKRKQKKNVQDDDRNSDSEHDEDDNSNFSENLLNAKDRRGDFSEKEDFGVSETKNKKKKKRRNNLQNISKDVEEDVIQFVDENSDNEGDEILINMRHGSEQRVKNRRESKRRTFKMIIGILTLNTTRTTIQIFLKIY